MRLLAWSRRALRRLVGRRNGEQDLDDELRAYVELLASEKVERGEGPAEARRRALLEAGGIEQVKESVRDVRAGALIEELAQDFRYGVRMLRRGPGFTAAAVLALALGIGATAAVFSVVNAVLLRPLPYAEPEDLVVVMHDRTNPVSPANFLDWRRDANLFEEMAAAQYWTPDMTATGRPERLYALRVTPDLFDVLGVSPLLGRTLTTAALDETEIVLGYRLWQRRFGGETDVLGRHIKLDNRAYTVVGVMPPSFRFAPFWATRAEAWAPLALTEPASRNAQSLRVFARLRPGATRERARSQMSAITARLEADYPGTNRDVTVNELTEIVVGDVRPSLLILLGAVGFVLLIACGNVAHMLLARATARHREFLVRAALGAGRLRIVRQCVTESMALALAGGAGGLALAAAATRALAALGPASVPRVDTISLDLRVLLFTLLVSVATGILFGIVPALHTRTHDLSVALREEGRGLTGGLRRGRARSVLVASEFALAVILLVGAGLMIRSFISLRAIDPGFDPRDVLTAIVSVGGSTRTQAGAKATFYPALVDRVRSLPGVESASAINHLPLAGDRWGTPFSIEGQPRPMPGERPSATYRVVLPGYFETMRLPLLRGRDFTQADRVGAPGVVIVNRRFAERHWPNEDPLGRRITPGDPDAADARWLTVIGVVENAVQREWTAAPEEEMYLPFLATQQYLEGTGTWVSYLTVVMRTVDDAHALVPGLREAVGSLDPDAVVAELQTMEAVVAEANAEPRFHLLLLAVFAAVALVLAALGIHAVIAYTVSRRTHEIGIRMALGARRSTVVGRIVGEGMVVALCGAAAGLVGALALTRVLAGLLYGVDARDPATFAAVPLILLAAALLASWLPARRATRIDPMAALRSD